MSTFASTVIDAGVLALPGDNATAESVHRYVNALLDWSALVNEDWICVNVSELSIENLISSNRYPLPEVIKTLLHNSGVAEYDANTVARAASRLLEITPSFEERYRLRNVLLENTSLSPQITADCTEECLKPDLERCLCLLALVHKCSATQSGREFPMIIRQAPQSSIKLRTQIHEVEHSRDDLPELPKPPDFFESEIFVCDSFAGLIASIDESSILIKAENDAEIELAVRVSLFKHDMEINGKATWPSQPVVQIGNVFRQSCQRCCLDKGAAMPSKILRTAVEMLRKLKLHTAHALRTDLKGSSPQKLRGTDKAWRRDIDRKLHLHFWECPQEEFELASVTFHDDFTIPE
ncbi:MAG: hypothetical protein K0U66_03100 [Gammaproteobacteria bacterium]|nr:hypothetical protein [Gammaproteobacteria bacterium]